MELPHNAWFIHVYTGKSIYRMDDLGVFLWLRKPPYMYITWVDAIYGMAKSTFLWRISCRLNHWIPKQDFEHFVHLPTFDFDGSDPFRVSKLLHPLTRNHLVKYCFPQGTQFCWFWTFRKINVRNMEQNISLVRVQAFKAGKNQLMTADCIPFISIDCITRYYIVFPSHLINIYIYMLIRYSLIVLYCIPLTYATICL